MDSRITPFQKIVLSNQLVALSEGDIGMSGGIRVEEWDRRIVATNKCLLAGTCSTSTSYTRYCLGLDSNLQ